MKKTLLFFAAFFFFVFLSAEELENENSEPQSQSENTQETESDTVGKECNCDVSRETNEKPKFFYFQPAVGFGTGLISGYRPTVSLNADLLVSHNEQINYYVGFDIDFKIAMRSYDMRLPIGLATKGNVVFDFMVIDDRELRSIGLWIELGLNLFFTYSRIGEFEFEETRHFSYGAAYGIGLDFVFKNYVVLKVGLDWFLYYTYPDLIILVGYRF